MTDDMPAPRSRGRARTSVAAGALILAVVAGTALSVVTQQNDDSSQRSRSQVASSASDAAVAVLAYRADTVDADVENAKSFLTGEFLDYYGTFGTQVVVPAAKERGITSSVTVAGSSVVSVSDGAAVALVFVNQNVTATESPEPTASSSSLRIELKRVADAWLVSKLDPV